jgi:hypothetical protein
MALLYAKETNDAYRAGQTVRSHSRALQAYPWLTNSVLTIDSFEQWIKDNDPGQEAGNLAPVVKVR